MIPSATVAPRRSPCPCCRRRLRHAAAGRPVPIGSSVTARVLAAGLWRLRQAERSVAHRQDNPQPSLLGGRKMKSRGGFGVGKQQSCRSHGNGMLDKIEAACCVVDYNSSYGTGTGIGIGIGIGIGGSMEKATKWDYLNNNGSNNHKLLGSSSRRRAVALEAALEKARAQMSELEDDRRVVAKKLRKVAEEKAWWKSKARCAAAVLREELKMERHHRRQLEAANAKLLKELASSRLSAKQAAQRVETERKARELMEEACEELSKEVDEDRAEVEALRRECVAMREEMEEERRMLQMAEVWREERVQMKLSDARALLEHKHAHLNTLQAEMESFLLRHGHRHPHKKVLLLRTMGNRMADDNGDFLSAAAYKSPDAPEDVDKVLDHFGRKNNATGTNRDTAATRSSSSGASVASPATDLFLEKVDASSTVYGVDGGGWAWERETPLPPDRFNAACSNNGNNGGSGVTDGGSGRSRRSGNFDAALIRRLWRSAISESRRKTAASSSSGRNRVVQNACSPSPSDSDRDRDRETPRSSVIDPASQAAGSAAAKEMKEKDMRKRKSLMEMLMEARMDDHRADNKPQAA